MNKKNILYNLTKIIILLLILVSTPTNRSFASPLSESGDSILMFRSGSEVLYDVYKTNKQTLADINNIISVNINDIVAGKGHIRIISYIPINSKEDVLILNMATMRAAVVRNNMLTRFPILDNNNFTFFIDTNQTGNSVKVSYIPLPQPPNANKNIHYSSDISNRNTIKAKLSRYSHLPFFEDSKTVSPMSLNKENEITSKPATKNEELYLTIDSTIITILYRWDKSNIDKTYLTNPTSFRQLDSIMSLKSAQHIDSLRIIAYASPEGHPKHNQWLSECRADSIKRYLINNYPHIVNPSNIITSPRGENWVGFRRFAETDNNLPMKKQVLSIIDNPSISDIERQDQIEKLDNGKLYKQYILPKYYRYLRNGASLFINYNPLVSITSLVPNDIRGIFTNNIIAPSFLDSLNTYKPISKVSYPIAFKTNLLFDAIGAPNLGIEIPIGDRFSVIGDFAYAYWRSPKNLYALQTLEGGVEGRYWFGVSDRKKAKNSEWDKPLRGWNIGVYGMYCSRYDIQFIDGFQGDGFWSAGVTAGYATPIARNLSLEFSIAAGYFYTSQYRHYHRPEKGLLMWQETGSFGVFSLTKARVSLVWLIKHTKNR